MNLFVQGRISKITVPSSLVSWLHRKIRDFFSVRQRVDMIVCFGSGDIIFFLSAPSLTNCSEEGLEQLTVF